MDQPGRRPAAARFCHHLTHSTWRVTLDSLGFVAFAAFAVVVTVAAWFMSQLFERRRRAALGAYAAHRGWSFEAGDDAWAYIAEGEPFGEGHGRTARYVMRGPYAGLTSVVFDYKWVTGTGNQRRTHRAGVYAVGLPAGLPWVHIRSEHMLDKAARLFGGQDIDLESEEFNRAFRVQAGDERFAYDLLNARTMEALLPAQALIVQVADRYLVATLAGGLDLDCVDYNLGLLVGMVERLPDYVWTDRGAQPPTVGKRSA